jgi:hypothetical protein
MEEQTLPLQDADEAPPEPIAIIRRAGPRLVRDALGPLAMFFLGWKTVGLGAGIGLALVFGVVVFTNERRRGRPAALVRVALVIVCLRAIVGLSSGSASVYLAQEIAIDLLLGCALLGTLAARRPLAAWIATDVYPFTPAMRASATFKEVMRTITLVWGAYYLVRCGTRLAAFLTLSTDNYALVIALSDAPVLIVLLVWSVRHTLAAFRRSEQWGGLLAQPGTVPAAPSGA